MLNKFWQNCINTVTHAFQPIVSPHSAKTFAVEALLRNFEDVGFKSVFDLLDKACNEKVLYEIDLALRKKAIEKFMSIEGYQSIKLFYNYDARLADMPDFAQGRTGEILASYGLSPEMFCFEISERHRITNSSGAESLFSSAKKSGCKIALDDFGAGFANFELFYFSEPQYLKLDRFLISNIHADMKKKKFCAHIISLAHFFGIVVVAEGVENKNEFNALKEAGVDLVQGFYIQKPKIKTDKISITNKKISHVIKNDKRVMREDEKIINSEIKNIIPVNVNDNVDSVLSMMKQNPDLPVIPVVDSNNFPLGIISENTLKKYLYTPFGKDLLYNKSRTERLRNFVTDCPVCEVTQPLENILERFVSEKPTGGVIISKDLCYYGFMDSQSLLNTLNEKNLAYARDMNPLTKLPGNTPINNFINDCYIENDIDVYLIYFDFDNFKPFNDRFGFRQGDRVITIFAELLKKHFVPKGHFVGHVGGDDFFAGIKDNSLFAEGVIELIDKVIFKFRESVLPIYDKDETEKGYYISKNRDGSEGRFELLGVSAAIVHISSGYERFKELDVSNILAHLKKEAKKSARRTAWKSLTNADIYNSSDFQHIT